MSRRPTLVYDGDCGFCRLWIGRWKALTGDEVEYAPYQSAAARFPEVPRERFAEAVHFFEDGRASRGAEAVLRSLSRAPGLSWLPRLYALPGAGPALEAGYRFVAARRPLFSRLTRLLWGETPAPAPVERAARLYLAALGLCYFLAFSSIALQIRGLVGENGIAPARALLEAARAQFGLKALWLVPSAFWLSASDAALVTLCWLGAGLSLLLVAGLAAGPAALACWALYLSVCSVGADFMSFQWDALLLEAGLVAALVPAWRRGGAPSRVALWLTRLILAKLLLESALVKLWSGDPSWTDLTALTYHYWTQPLPNPASWFTHHLPVWFHKLSCLFMFAVELSVPVLVLLPRRARFLGAALTAALMAAVAVTGNYGFFNLLTAALGLACLDDRMLGADGAPRPGAERPALALAAVWLAASLAAAGLRFGRRPTAPERALLAAVFPLRSFNAYGLFAVMTKERDEIELEVTADGSDWRVWPFKHKPSDARRAPPVVAPHMPRLDWQMWFAALGESRHSAWFGNLVFRVLDGSPQVAALLGPSPLAGTRPAYARATRWRTRFTTPEERRAGAGWWARERKGLFFPVVALNPR